MRPKHVARGGTYLRVCDPSWTDPGDITYSKRYGGRWNAPGEFGVLYLNGDIGVAAANANRSLRIEFGDAVTFTDIKAERRPEIQGFIVAEHRFVNALTEVGVAALELPAEYPKRSTHRQCQRIGLGLYQNGEAGIAARSSVAEGEELAIFDSHRRLSRRKSNSRKPFDEWYPGFA